MEKRPEERLALVFITYHASHGTSLKFHGYKIMNCLTCRFTFSFLFFFSDLLFIKKIQKPSISSTNISRVISHLWVRHWARRWDVPLRSKRLPPSLLKVRGGWQVETDSQG